MPDQQTKQRRCEYCGNTFDSQGLYLHVRNTDDDVHGEVGSTPDGFDPMKAPTVGGEDVDSEETVEVDEMKEEPEEAPNRLFLCNWCGRDPPFKGKRGLAIHLSKSAGNEMHPEGASIDDENYTAIPADENYNPLVDEETMDKIRQREVADSEKAEAMQELEILDTETTEQTDTMAEAQQRSEELSDDELEQRLDEIYVPTDTDMREQVAAVITQEPALYNRPELVRDLVNCSRTTFYEGRKLYDAGMEVKTSPDESESEESPEPSEDSFERLKEVQGHSVTVDGVTMVPIHELEDAIRRIEQLEEELDERAEMYR